MKTLATKRGNCYQVTVTLGGQMSYLIKDAQNRIIGFFNGKNQQWKIISAEARDAMSPVAKNYFNVSLADSEKAPDDKDGKDADNAFGSLLASIYQTGYDSGKAVRVISERGCRHYEAGPEGGADISANIQCPRCGASVETRLVVANLLERAAHLNDLAWEVDFMRESHEAISNPVAAAKDLPENTKAPEFV